MKMRHYISVLRRGSFPSNSVTLRFSDVCGALGRVLTGATHSGGSAAPAAARVAAGRSPAPARTRAP